MINWGALQGGGFQNALAQGIQMGQMAGQARREREVQNALAQFDPSNPDTLKPVMQADARIGMQLRGQMQQAQAAQAQAEAEAAKARRADLPMLTRLLETATDEASYQRNLGVARQYGIDTSTLPQNFAPAWRDEQLATMKLLSTPEGREALSTAGKIAADMGLQPGTPEFAAETKRIFIAQQNKTLSYQPGGNAVSFNPYTGEREQLVQGEAMPDAMDFNPDEWDIVGDAGGNASGGF